jgi:predicted dehydrogenase
MMPPIEPFSPSGIPGIPQQQIVSDNDNINIGSGNQIIGGGNPSPVAVTNVTTPTYTALATDYFLCVDVAAPVTITLPTGILGTVYIVKDCDGDANTNPITINGTGGQLVDGSTATINSPYGSISLIFNGTEWSIV